MFWRCGKIPVKFIRHVVNYRQQQSKHISFNCNDCIICFQVTPLTSLKFAELVAKAGFPPGVVNILPGSGMLNTPGNTGILDTSFTHVLSMYSSCSWNNETSSVSRPDRPKGSDGVTVFVCTKLQPELRQNVANSHCLWLTSYPPGCFSPQS